MRDRAGFLAALSDSLTEMCLFYAVGGLLVAGRRWGVHLFWLLLWAAFCTVFFALLLRRGRSVPALTAVTGALGLAGFGLFALFSVTPLGFGYGFVMLIGAGMAVGLPLYFTLHRPRILAHVTQVDVLIGALLFFLLAREALGLDAGTLVLTGAVLLLDVAAAAALRMDEDGTGAGGGTFRAALTAFCAALLLAGAVWLISLVFSHSGSVTGGIFRAIGALFAALGAGIESAMGRLVSLLAREERFEAVELTGELPSVAGAELGAESITLPVNTTVLGLILCLAMAAAMTAVALLFRRHRLRRAGEAILSSDPERGVIRTGGTVGILLARLRAALAFRRAAFLYRNTPAGLLVTAERRGRRVRLPRGPGETMRAYLTRLDPSGGLNALADALDRQFYGAAAGGEAKPDEEGKPAGSGWHEDVNGNIRVLSARQCRQLRRYLRRTVKRRPAPGKEGDK